VTHITVYRNHWTPTWNTPAVCSMHLPRLWWLGSGDECCHKKGVTDHVRATTYDGVLKRNARTNEPPPQRTRATHMLSMAAADDVLPSSKNQGLNPMEVPARMIRRCCRQCWATTVYTVRGDTPGEHRMQRVQRLVGR
jgi:hypothetical protein